MAYNADHLSANRDQLATIRNSVGDVVDVQLRSDDPIASVYALREALSRAVDESLGIVIDITTFTHETLQALLGLATEYANPTGLTLLYAPASEYSIGDPPDLKWLSRGVRKIRTIVGFPGHMQPSRPTHAILLCGLEDDRAAELLRQLEPGKMSLGYPSEAAATNPTSALVKDRVMSLQAVLSDAETFAFDPLDPVNVRDAILTCVGTTPRHNILVASLSSKLSIVGVVAAARREPRIQLLYASAEVYNQKNYSRPGREVVVVSWTDVA